MTITIAGKQYTTRKPKNLDAALIASTGCDAAETLHIISGVPLPARLGAAALPFLGEGEDAPLLADVTSVVEAELAREGSTIVADVQKLYRDAAPTSDVKGGAD